MTLVDHIIRELDAETVTTRKVLERVPADKFAWKPHDKSMSLGQLAQHVASTPGVIAESSVPDTYAAEDFKQEPAPTSVADLLKTLDASLATAKSVISALDETKAMGTWTMTFGGKPALSMPRLDWLRIYMLNHWYHHGGQLSVYLRELNVPVPAMYGPSADEQG